MRNTSQAPEAAAVEAADNIITGNTDQTAVENVGGQAVIENIGSQAIIENADNQAVAPVSEPRHEHKKARKEQGLEERILFEDESQRDELSVLIRHALYAGDSSPDINYNIVNLFSFPNFTVIKFLARRNLLF